MYLNLKEFTKLKKWNYFNSQMKKMKIYNLIINKIIIKKNNKNCLHQLKMIIFIIVIKKKIKINRKKAKIKKNPFHHIIK